MAHRKWWTRTIRIAEWLACSDPHKKRAARSVRFRSFTSPLVPDKSLFLLYCFPIIRHNCFFFRFSNVEKNAHFNYKMQAIITPTLKCSKILILMCGGGDGVSEFCGFNDRTAIRLCIRIDGHSNFRFRDTERQAQAQANHTEKGT